MTREEIILIPRWTLENIENTLRIQHNINSENKCGETCQDRNIKESLNCVRKLLKGEEITGRERLEELQPQLPSDAKKDLWEELDAYICHLEGELSEEELGRLRLVAEHFYLCGENPNVHLIGELPTDVEEAAEKYLESVPNKSDEFYWLGLHLALKEAFKAGWQAGAEYERGKIIKEIKEQVERWMPDNPEGDEYLSGERVAFRSVLHLLKEKEEKK